MGPRVRSALLSAPVALALLLDAPPTARAYLPPAYGGSVVAPLPGGVVSRDPASARRAAELQLTSLVYDTLYRRDARGRPQPHLALDHEVSSDGRRWRIRLRTGVVLHDASELQPADVARSLERARHGAAAHLLAAVKRIDASGSDRIEIHLRRRFDRLLLALSAPCTAIAAKRSGRLTGSGPFSLSGHRTGRFTLVAHLAHFAGRPYADRLQLIVYRRAGDQASAYEVGSAQLSLHGASRFGGSPSHRAERVDATPASTLLLLVGGRDSELGAGPLRRALEAAIDRRALPRLVGTGRAVPAGGPLAPALSRRKWRISARNIGRARKLLTKARRRSAALSTAAKLGLLVDRSRFNERTVAGKLVAALDKIGLVARIDSEAPARYEKRLAGGDFQLALVRHTPQLAQRHLALAGVLARIGETKLAARCMVRRCSERWVARRVARRAIPLLHLGLRVHHDARLGGLRIDEPERIAYEGLFWRRKPHTPSTP